MALTSEGAVLTDRHRRAQVRLAITADSQARRVWDSTLDVNDLKGSQPIWKNAVLDLMQVWWKVSADTAAQYLPRFREAETGEPGDVEVGVPRFDRRQASRRIDWAGATNVLWHIARGETQEAAYEAARSLFLGMFHEAVLTGGRTTIERWAKKDPRAIGWRRVSDGDPCAFCAMLVTRGPVYTSQAHAGLSAKTGKKYHPHCGCTVEVVYGDWKPTRQEQQWIDDYYRAAESLPKGVSRTYDAILPIMRRNGGYRDGASRRGAPEYLASRRNKRAALRAMELERRRRELEKALSGKGLPMSIDKADRSNTNPRYDRQRGYQINCQSCVPAYEMRRRGYDVEARAYTEREQHDVRIDSTRAWINPRTGRQPARRHVGGRDAQQTIIRIGKRIKPGERYALEFGWERTVDGHPVMGDGHIVVLERPRTQGGRIIMVVDPQTGHKTTLERYMRKSIYLRSVAIYRIDDLDLNPKAAPALMRARPR